MEKFLCTKEVAKELKVSKMTISRMVEKGILNPVNTHTRFFLFKESEVIFVKDSKIN